MTYKDCDIMLNEAKQDIELSEQNYTDDHASSLALQSLSKSLLVIARLILQEVNRRNVTMEVPDIGNLH